LDALEDIFTCNVCPFVIVPLVPNAPPLMLKVAPFVAVTVAAELIPLIVMLFDVIAVAVATPV
jgi:hypothetical protein